MAGDTVIGGLYPVGWSDRLAGYITDLPSSPLKLPVGEYRRRIEAGELRALEYRINGQAAGCLLWRPEAGAQGPEFVVVAAIAPGHSGMSLVDLMMPGIEAWAAKLGCGRVRCHTGRAGLVRRLQSNGYVHAETVLIKDVS
jgi:hypothetical protein